MRVLLASIGVLVVVGVGLTAWIVMPHTVRAETADDIKAQIDEQNAKLDAINREITQYEAQLAATSHQKTTLQTKLNGIIASLKKTAASIAATKNRLVTTELQLQELATNISTTQGLIRQNKAGLSETLRIMDRADRQPLVVALLGSDNVSDAWEEVDASAAIQSAVRAHIASLAGEEQTLSQAKDETDKKKQTLESQKKTLETQQGSMAATKKAQDELLAQTKAKESEYQSLIKKKKAQQASLEAALSDLNERFQKAVSASQITPVGEGILQWPVDNVVVTQYFGNTPFAASGAYAGKGHNGIDLGIPIGTPLKAALSGTVVGAGNTDAVSGCYSFGKWVMIKHANGLNTMYAHLSQIKVSQGQSVQTGDVIGYSGETGYATGPHLHFGVYVSSATEIIKLGQATNRSTPCASAVMPVAPLSGYLNPLNYLPAR